MNKYYAILGLPATASKDEVRKKYRKLVLLWHPDKNPSAEAPSKFIAITEAYDILMGERTVPRSTSFTTKRRSATTAPPPQKKTTRELYREKFLNERARIKKDPRFAQMKMAAERKAKLWKILAGTAIAFVFIPWFIAEFNIITCMVLTVLSLQCIVSFWVHSHNLSKQAQMTYGESDNYDYTEIRDYFLPKHKLRWGSRFTGSTND